MWEFIKQILAPAPSPPAEMSGKAKCTLFIDEEQELADATPRKRISLSKRIGRLAKLDDMTPLDVVSVFLTYGYGEVA